MTERPTLSWHALNAESEVGHNGDRVVAVLYTVVATASDGSEWMEFCCLLTDTPRQDVDVLFGVAEGTEGWDSRWERGRRA